MRILISLLLFFSVSLNAQIVINEFSAANTDDYLCSNGEFEDWIELYNNGASSVNLAGYYLSDNATKPQRWLIPAGTIIPAKGRLVFVASGLNSFIAPNWHTNFKITQTDTSEAVVLVNPSGAIIDINEIDVPNQKNHSIARITDGGVWGVAVNPSPGAANSGVSARYAETPDFDIAAGYYAGSQLVTLATPEPGGFVRYSLDGSEPTPTSTLYSGPININATKVLRTRTFSANPNVLPSHIEMNTYFIGAGSKHSLKVISISGDNIMTLMNGNQISPEGTFELFDENGKFLDENTGEFNKHGNDSWAYAQRGLDYIVRDQFGNDDEINNKLFPGSERKGFSRLILKAAANDNYPAANGAHLRDGYVATLAERAGMDLDVRRNEFCVLYVNGAYWGVYDYREKVDDKDFTNYYYNLDETEIDFIKTWGGTWAEYGTLSNWSTLRSYILANDMTVPANFQYVSDRLNLLSLADYFIINIHTVCKDWLNWNTAWWHGSDASGNKEKWRYTLWDMDATFGHYINYTGIPNTTPAADPCDIEQLPQGGDPQDHTDVLTKLFDNKSFRDMYINRYADLNNTYLSCDYMVQLLNEMKAQLEPEMPRQINKWGGNMPAWLNNVKAMEDFIKSRCVEIEDGLVDCYTLKGPYPVTIVVLPVGSPNDVKVNTLVPPNYPYSGKYYGGTTLSFEGLAGTGWKFDKWESAKLPMSPNLTTALVTSAIDQPSDTVYAYFVQECSVEITAKSKTVDFIDCKNAPLTIEVTTQKGSPNLTLSWYDLSQTKLPIDVTGTFQVFEPGEYIVEVTDNDLLCTVYDTIEILDKTTPPAIALSSVDPITCIVNSVDLDATGSDSGTGFAYSWAGPCLQNPSNVPNNLACTIGSYTLVITNSQTGCTATASTNVTENIITPDDAIIVSSTQELPCAGVPLDLNGQGQTGYQFSWTTINGNISGPTSGISTQINQLGWYFMITTNPINGCTAKDSIEVIPNSQSPNIDKVSLKGPSCDVAANGSIEIISVISGTPGFTYSINGSPFGGPLFGNLSAGSYTVLVKDAQGCVSDSVINLQINPDLPDQMNVAVLGASCEVAPNGTIQLSNVSGGLPSYSFSLNGGAPVTAADFTGLLVGNYTIQILDALGCKYDTTIAIGLNYELPDVVVLDISDASCAVADNASINILSTSGGTGPYSYNFNNSGFGTNTNFSDLAPGNYTFTVKDAVGCTYLQSVSVEISEDLPIISELMLEKPSCAIATNGSILIETIKGGTGPYTVAFNGAAPTTDLFWENLSAGSYSILIVDSYGCETSETIDLPLGKGTQVDLGPDFAANAYSPIILSPNIIFGLASSYTWTPAVCNGCSSANFVLTQDTIISITIVDDFGCEDTDEIAIKIIRQKEIYAGNVFSPNGDGNNDYWRLYPRSIQSVIKELQIFDRWGALVFAINNLPAESSESWWRGTIGGKEAGQGVYVYFAKVETSPREFTELSGEITLIR